MSATATNDVPIEERQYTNADTKKMLAGKKRRRALLPLFSQQLLWIMPPLLMALIVLTVWYFASSHLNSRYGLASILLLPPPLDVLTSLGDGLKTGMFLKNALVTVQESLSGFLLAVLLALPLGYAVVKSRWLAAMLQPYIAAAQAIPAVALAPLLVLWLGYGPLPIMVLCMLIVVFPMIITTMLGVQTIERDLIDAARVEGASGWSMLTAIEFPLALPAILAGVRTALTLSITGAVVGEFVNGGNLGLGTLVLQAQQQLETPLLFATLVVLASLAALYYAFSWLLVRLAQVIY